MIVRYIVHLYAAPYRVNDPAGTSIIHAAMKKNVQDDLCLVLKHDALTALKTNDITGKVMDMAFTLRGPALVIKSEDRDEKAVTNLFHEKVEVLTALVI